MSESYLELERKLRPLANPLPAPRPGDWLAEHPEPGQTFDQYVRARPVRRSATLSTIHVCFVGHFHRWLAATPERRLPWGGRRPLVLDPAQRHLVVVHAVCAGRCALFDTATKELTPFGEG